MKNAYRTKKIDCGGGGYTLIEMIVYVSLLASVIMLVFNVIFFIDKTNKEIIVLSQINANAQMAMDRISFEVANAKYAYLPTSNFFNYNFDANKARQISLATNINLPANETFSYLDFYLENNTIFLKKDGSGPEALTSANVKVSGLNFYYYKNDWRESVSVDMTVSSANDLNSSATIHLIGATALRSANN